ncbi:uncharacterized protein HRG_10028 [Hirsutella rhossiliensis]|uniref:Uncharacterized protein n=1 Tax=Hirsutella rhossiliensis TaxID=111463 RepID=A0A9P8SDQ0_9HYPO|nr:uncharacterized protein HRG_10028 [Hirsutella rhossiliensis]KAH0958983.1 hypothetical protein HRG_10028 [Hirsutella rhossiliensis]
MPAPHLRKPLDSQRGAGGEMSMMSFVQPDCPARFSHQDDHRIRGLNAEAMARVFLPPPAWLLNLSIYGQPIDPSDWTEEWFFMHARVHPYALAWEVEQRDGLESDTGRTFLYTMPALVVRDQGYQPVLPRLFASMGDFPCIPPIVSFTGLIVGTGHSSLRRDLLPGLGAAQLNCCGFVRLSTYVAPGMPNKVPFKGFHPFQVFVIFPVRANPWAILCKVAGLLRHDVMLYPGLGPGQRLYRRPGFLDFLDKAAAAVTTMAPLLSTPQRQQASSASAAFRDSSTLGFGFALDRPPYAARETILP